MFLHIDQKNPADIAAIDDHEDSLTYGELVRFCDHFGEVLGKRTLIFILSENCIGAFAGYIFYMIKIALKASKEGKKIEIEGGSVEDIKLISVPLSILFIIGGAAAIAIGGDITVDAASRIASDLGMSKTLIGLTIISIGTSLPELVTSVTAAKKGNAGIAIGNIVGSNIFNILFVIGTTSLICTVPFESKFIIDTIIAIASGAVLWLGTYKNRELRKPCGIVMLLGYAAYFIYLCV